MQKSPKKGSPPHTRGQLKLAGFGGMDTGSPPHTRGQHPEDLEFLPTCRITPAYAGTTSYAWIVALGFEDHPRIRGDNSYAADFDAEIEGSPPHTRGQRINSSVIKHVDGITPAYAGTTAYPLHYRRQSWDHPRIRGDNFQRTQQ